MSRSSDHSPLDDADADYIRFVAERSLRLRVARDLFHLEVAAVRLLDLMGPCPRSLRIQLRHLVHVSQSTAESLTRSVLDEEG